MYQQPNNQPPNTYYAPQPGYPPQQPWQQPPMMPPQPRRESRMPVKIVAIICLALGFVLSLVGSPALGGIFVLSGFVAIFFI